MSKLLDVFYGRVSSDLLSQDTSVQRQEEIGRSLGCDLVLIDRESGRDIARQKYTELVDLIREGKVRSVTATRSDRLMRNASEQKYFYQLCIKNNVIWKFIEEPQLNSDSPAGEILRREAAHYAEMESFKLGTRQEAAYTHAEAKGRVISRTIPLGFRVTKERQYEVDFLLPDGSNAIAKDEFKTYASGEIARCLVNITIDRGTVKQAFDAWKKWLLTLEVIDQKRCDRLLKFRYTSIHEWLEHPVLRGHLAYGRYKKIYEDDQVSRTMKTRYILAPQSEWRIQYNTHAGLITTQEGKEIDAMIERNKSWGYALAEATRADYVPPSLSPILRCGCGCAMVQASTHYSTKKEGMKVCAIYYCGSRPVCKESINERKLVEQIIPQIGDRADELLGIINIAELDEFKSEDIEIAKLRLERSKVLESYEVTKMDVFLKAEQELTEKIDALTQKLSPPKLDEDSELMLRVIKDREYWETMPPVERNGWFRKLLGKVVVQQGKVTLSSLLL